ncbi:MAG TPA: phosphotransferase [Ilumatobacteraceae bacterium]
MTTAGSYTGFTADPVVPSRELLLDSGFVADRIGSIFARRSVSRCSLRWANYYIGESLRLAYDVAVDGRQFVMSARTFTDSAAVFERARASAEPVDGMPGIAHDPTTQTVWWTVPNDRRLRNLGTLLEPPNRVRQSSGVAWDRSALMRYSPECSATAQVLDADGQVTGYAKAYGDRDALEVAEQYNRMAASMTMLDNVRTPRALGWARPDRIVVLEPMPGRQWVQLPADVQPVAMRHLGAALANVHGLPTPFGRGSFQRYRPERIVHSADLVGLARNDVATDVRRLGDRLAEEAPARAPAVNLHGDLQTQKVLFHGDQVHILDVDRGGSGPASADLGSVLASVLAHQVVNPDKAVDGLGGELLDGYRSVRSLPSEGDLRWHTAAAVVAERAIRAVNRINESTLAVLPDLVALGEEVLEAGVLLDG